MRQRQPLFTAAGALVAAGATLAVVPPALQLNSGDCGPLSCFLAQTVGKLAVCIGVALLTGWLTVRSLAARQWSAAALAALLMLPAVVWAVLVVQTHQQTEAGTTEVQQMVGAATSYAAQTAGTPVSELRGLAIDGKQGWAVVRVTDRQERDRRFVLLRRSGGVWFPEAIGPTFTREELRAFGAPTDLMRDAG